MYFVKSKCLNFQLYQSPCTQLLNQWRGVDFSCKGLMLLNKESSFHWFAMPHRSCSLQWYNEDIFKVSSKPPRGWVGLWGFLWWAPSAKRKDHHGVSSGWSRIWHRSNSGLSSTQYEQIPIILGVWPFWLTPFFFRSITFWRAYG